MLTSATQKSSCSHRWAKSFRVLTKTRYCNANLHNAAMKCPYFRTDLINCSWIHGQRLPAMVKTRLPYRKQTFAQQLSAYARHTPSVSISIFYLLSQFYSLSRFFFLFSFFLHTLSLSHSPLFLPHPAIHTHP